MPKLNVQFPSFSNDYVGNVMRAFVRQLEIALKKVDIFTGSPYTNISSAHTVTSDDNLIIVDTTGGDLTITLPLVTLGLINSRFEVVIKKKVAAHTITIAKTSTDTVDGASSISLATVNTFYRLRAITGGWITV